jgi:hypothetical protein
MRNDRADVARILREQRIEAASARCRCPRARVRVSSFPWSKPPDRTALELLVRLCAGETPVRFRGAARSTVDRCPIAATASTSFRQGDGVNSSKRLRSAAAARGTTRRRASLSCFRRESRVSRRERRTFRVASAALDAGVTPKLSNPTRFLAMIAIENI